jgi:hypothetical protein
MPSLSDLSRKRRNVTTQPMQFDVSRPQYQVDPMQVQVGPDHYQTQPMVFPVAPTRQAGEPVAAPIGAVDAQPGTKLYELAMRRQASQAAKAGSRKKPDEDAQVLASLLGKAVPGAASPGEGMIPFGALPQHVQGVASQVWKQPLVGFDPTKLDNRERFMLERLRMMAEKETQERIAKQPPRQGPYGAMPGAGGGV